MDDTEKPAEKPKFNPNTATDMTDEQVAEIFDYHSWSSRQIAAGAVVRAALGRAYRTIVKNVTPCPDRTVALRKITEARMDCNSAITHLHH